MKQVDIGPKWI